MGCCSSKDDASGSTGRKKGTRKRGDTNKSTDSKLTPIVVTGDNGSSPSEPTTTTAKGRKRNKSVASSETADAASAPSSKQRDGKNGKKGGQQQQVQMLGDGNNLNRNSSIGPSLKSDNTEQYHSPLDITKDQHDDSGDITDITALPLDVAESLALEEEGARAVLVSKEQRIRDMYLHDHQDGLEKLRPLPLISFEDDGSDDDDFDSRRCSMTVKQLDSASDVGKRARKAEEESLTRSPARRNLDPHSRAAISRHDNEDDCWVVIRNKIYDLTSFVHDHPGGVWVLIDSAGKDATSMFESSHQPYVCNSLDEYFVANVIDADRI